SRRRPHEDRRPRLPARRPSGPSGLRAPCRRPERQGALPEVLRQVPWAGRQGRPAPGQPLPEPEPHDLEAHRQGGAPRHLQPDRPGVRADARLLPPPERGRDQPPDRLLDEVEPRQRGKVSDMDPQRLKDAYQKLQMLDDRLTYKVRPKAGGALTRPNPEQLEQSLRDLATYT